MRLKELKKAEPATMKSSGTDDPKKYVGKWEEYKEPQGIKDRKDPKVLTKEAVEEWNGKNVIWTNQSYYVAVDDPDDATFVTVWTSENKKIGELSVRTIPGYRQWYDISYVEISPVHRGHRLGYRMFQAILQYMEPSKKGLSIYRPDISNKKQIPSILRRLGAVVDRENEDVYLIPRKEFFEEFHESYKNHSPNIGYGLWITPAGEVLQVDDYEGHEGTAAEHFNRSNKHEAVLVALQHGWVQVSNGGDVGGTHLRISFHTLNRLQAMKLIRLINGSHYSLFSVNGYYDLAMDEAVQVLRDSITLRENSFGPQDMTTRFAPDPDEDFMIVVGPEEKKEIRRSKKAPRAQARANAKALSAPGHPPMLDARAISEAIRRPIAGTLTQEYEVTEGDEVVGRARVQEGVIDLLDFDTDAPVTYQCEILSAVLSLIVRDADRQSANLSIQIEDMDLQIKYLFERFGFRHIGNGVMRRALGGIKPFGGVNSPQGMVNRDASPA